MRPPMTLLYWRWAHFWKSNPEPTTLKPYMLHAATHDFCLLEVSSDRSHLVLAALVSLYQKVDDDETC